MESLITWIGAAFGGLLVVATAVAVWEHLARSAQPAPEPRPAPPRAVSVDVALDALVARPPGDADERRATLGHAIDRMGHARPPADAWVETRPMVNPGLPPAPAPSTHQPH